MRQVEFSSRLYHITEGSRFRRSLKDFPNSQEQDIQKWINRLDTIGENVNRWLFLKKVFVLIGKTPKGGMKCKGYIAISPEKLSATRGARLYLGMKNLEKEVIILRLIRKSQIASGSKTDVADSQANTYFADMDDE